MSSSPADKQKLILTDFDGTLTRSDTFPQFLRYAAGPLRFYCLLPAAAFFALLCLLGIFSRQTAKEHIFSLYFKGCEQKKLEQLGRDFSQYILANSKKIFWPGALDMIARARAAGTRVVVVSASADIWIAPFAASVGAECLATRWQFRDGRFVGRIDGRNCRREEKISRIRQLIPDFESYCIDAYGDTSGDTEMLAAADTPHFKPFR